MSGTFIFLTVIVITLLLGRYAIREGQRIENQKKFMKNMKRFDTKNKK